MLQDHFITCLDELQDPIESDSSDTSSTSTISASVSFDQPSITTISEIDGLQYIAGFIAKKYLKMHPELGNFTYKNKSLHNYAIPSWVQHLSFGGLIEPSALWKEEIDNLEKHFNKYHKNKQLRNGTNVIKKTADYLKKNLPLQ